MMQTNPHACGVDDTACPSTPLKAHACGVDDGPLHLVPVPSPVLSVGHFSRALLGHSCQAPKLGWTTGSPTATSSSSGTRIIVRIDGTQHRWGEVPRLWM